MTPVSTWTKRDKIAAMVIVAFGAIIRLKALLGGRALWCDEAMLAMNLTQRGFRGLLRPLDWNQAAPVGFLIAEKLMTVLFGRSEIVMRLIPFTCGIGCLVLGAWLCRRFLGPLAGLTGLFLLASSETLVYYSNELKQYECDVFVFLAFVYAAICAYESRWRRRDIWLLVAIGTAGVFFSHTIIFALGGFFLGLCVLEGPAHLLEGWKTWGWVAGVWAAAFAVDYFIFLRPTTTNKYLYATWATGFPPSRLISADAARWVVRAIYLNLAFAIGGSGEQFVAGLLLVLIPVGLVYLWRTQRGPAVFLWSPLLLVLIATLARKFPFEGRLITFLVPGTLVTAAAALDALPTPTAGIWRWSLAGGLCLLPLLGAMERLAAPDRREEIRTVLSDMKPRLAPGDTIYVYWGAWPAFTYYRPVLNDQSLTVVDGTGFTDHFEAYERDVDQLKGHGRVWLVVSHVPELLGQGYFNLLAAPFAHAGRELQRFSDVGAQAVLFQM